MPAAVGGLTLVRDEAYWQRREVISAECGGDVFHEQERIEELHSVMFREQEDRMVEGVSKCRQP